MNKAGLVIAAAGALAASTVAVPQAAQAHDGFGPGFAGGVIAGAVVGGLAANAAGPGYYYDAPGYAYAPGPVYYDAAPGFYYGGPHYYRHHWRHRHW